jgi:Xaa-Pro aminopeptidase
MHTMHPTLLIGPADWDRVRWPRQAFAQRLARLWQDHPDAVGAMVYGNASDHAALAYLTHFTPKLEAALALIPRAGAPHLLVGGGVNMLPAARPLTFIKDLGLLRGVASAAEWVRGLPAGHVVLIGGTAMPYDLRSALDAAFAPRLTNGDDPLRRRMRTKSAREHAALRTACATLQAATTALQTSFRSSRGVTDCVLAAEHAALQAGAQDVRSLFALDRGPTLRPFDRPIQEHIDPLQVYLAVQHDGYWAEAFLPLSDKPHAISSRVRDTVDAMVAAAKPGLSSSDLWRIVEKSRDECGLHPCAAGISGCSIGLALDEELLRKHADDVRLAPGGVYSLRAGFCDGDGVAAVASAMVIVTDMGCERIWPPAQRI